MKKWIIAIVLLVATPSLGMAQFSIGLDGMFADGLHKSEYVHYAEKEFRRHQLHVKDDVVEGRLINLARKPEVGMDVLLLNGDQVVAKSKTDSGGRFKFTNVPEGTFGFIGQSKNSVITFHFQVKQDATLEKSETLTSFVGAKKPAMKMMHEALDRIPTRANKPKLPVKRREGHLATTLNFHQITVQDVPLNPGDKPTEGVVFVRVRAMGPNGEAIVAPFTPVMLKGENGEFKGYTNENTTDPQMYGVAVLVGVPPGEYTLTSCNQFARQNGHDYDGFLSCGVSIVECPPEHPPVVFEGSLSQCGELQGEILVQEDILGKETFCEEELTVGQCVPCGGYAAGGSGFCGGGGGGSGGFGSVLDLAAVGAFLAAAAGGGNGSSGGRFYEEDSLKPLPPASPVYPEPRYTPPPTAPKPPPKSVVNSFNPNSGTLVPRTGQYAQAAVKPYLEPEKVSPF